MRHDNKITVPECVTVAKLRLSRIVRMDEIGNRHSRARRAARHAIAARFAAPPRHPRHPLFRAVGDAKNPGFSRPGLSFLFLSVFLKKSSRHNLGKRRVFSYGKARVFFEEGLASFGLPLFKKGEQRRHTEKIGVFPRTRTSNANSRSRLPLRQRSPARPDPSKSRNTRPALWSGRVRPCRCRLPDPGGPLCSGRRCWP